MMRENILKIKSKAFAIRIVNAYKYLTTDKKEFVLSKQLLRSGTSIGAMLAECEYAESKADFVHKLAIAQKETNETIYWLELLRDTFYLDNLAFLSMQQEGTELLKLITSSIKTAKNSIKQ